MDKSIDFQIEMSSNQEDIQMADDDDVDLYGDLSIVLLANDQPDVLDYFEDLSDLSGDEFLEEYSTKTQPAAPGEDTSDDLSDDEILEDPAEARTLQPCLVSTMNSELSELAADGDDMLSFSEEDLLEGFGDPVHASTRPSSPISMTVTPPTSPATHDDNGIQLAEANTQPEQGCDPAVLHRTEKDLE